ncbi:adenine phosphoribosyltransferase [Salinibacterium sp. ZJ70]|uniref:adenine phosphoribosyltransferase n=1 Tax=Salinibacterium sp. ZJ70 TaxID=2708084 RepID=UPI00141EC09F|nr:adenine phosphoribosyltransferase [Salinibacterium sp. ZJ70]
MTPAPAHLDRLTRVIPDFPEPGILFRDLTPVFADGPALASVADALVEPFNGEYDVVAGVEARGFALAAASAARSGHGLLLIRKAGKLPGETLRESYALEYGEATLEVHTGQVPAGTRVLLVDDVLATGGTLAASQRLIARAGWVLAGTSVVLELDGLGGRDKVEGHVHTLQLA